MGDPMVVGLVVGVEREDRSNEHRITRVRGPCIPIHLPVIIISSMVASEEKM